MIRTILSIFFSKTFVRTSRASIRGGGGAQDEGAGFGTGFTNNWNET